VLIDKLVPGGHFFHHLCRHAKGGSHFSASTDPMPKFQSRYMLTEAMAERASPPIDAIPTALTNVAETE
jgi:hypothetical protein